ncbi:hypothetical protein HYH03_014522 [Edaphochlamys debaryana]|uniref:PDEase domain-containing protein n=1 Tax=Edaphochlamys debaryana TaxID=47281 RepID=A0A835XNL5_9CHLO|nr:hypothetical protein HYH03_014522 [Edaphochlamys debaryana]|eukprot:KAG2486839.1 hypothetical protein HYH03_014522 [Edaphochlamys debaryana]
MPDTKKPAVSAPELGPWWRRAWQSVKEHARSLALDAALRYRTQLAASFAPVQALASLVARRPQYNTTSRLFNFLAPALVDMVSAVVTLDALDGPSAMDGTASPLRALEARGYAFALTAPPLAGVEGPWLVVASSGAGPGGSLRDPLEAVVELQGLKWRLQVAPRDGSWTPAWYGGAIAAVAVASAAAAGMLFALLISRYHNRALLRMLLPRELLNGISAQQAKELGERAMEEDTPADVLLNLLSALLEGEPPDVRDVVLVRAVLQQGRDVYRPLDLEGRIQEAHLETDVADALMRQLGARNASSQWPGATAANPSGLPSDPCAPSTPALGGVAGARAPALLSGAGAAGRTPPGWQLQAFTRPSLKLFESPMHEALGFLLSNAADPGAGPALAPTAAAVRAQASALRRESSGQLSTADITMAFFSEPGPADEPQPPQSCKGGAAGLGLTWTATPSALATAAAAAAETPTPRGRKRAAAGTSLTVTMPTGSLAAAAAAAARPTAPDGQQPKPGLLLRLGIHSGAVSALLTSAASRRCSGEALSSAAAAAAAVSASGVEPGEASPFGHSRRLSALRSSDASVRGGVAGGSASLAPPPPALLDKVESLLVLATTPGCWQFDSFALASASGGHALSAMGFYLLSTEGLIAKFGLQPNRVARLLRALEAGYPDNPYHCATHAADVLRSLHALLHGAQLTEHYLDPLGLLGAYLAAIVHDLGHPGLTGDFLVATSAPLALRYNDRSPLESHHASAAFSLLAERPDLDALAPLGKEQRAALRKMVIDLVLGTDMKQHFAMLSQFKAVRRSGRKGSEGQNTTLMPPLLYESERDRHRSCAANAIGFTSAANAIGCSSAANTGSGPQGPPTPVDDAERLLSLQLALKVADIGHLGSELGVHKRWLAALEEEFFRQGDREKALGLPISPLFDRSKTGVSKSQVGFYDFVALPLVRALADAFPGARGMQTCFEANYHHWKEQSDLTATPPRRA